MEYTMMELLPVVQYLSERYTGKESGSVTYDMANQLMEAVLYCIREFEHAGQWGQTGAEPQSTALYDQACRPAAIQAYDEGYRLVLEKTSQAKTLYDNITKRFHSYGCTACFDTVIKGMPSFFLYYDARFNPQNHILTLDYPVLISQEHLNGVDRIMAYLHCIQAEQKFLGKFPEPLVRQALAGQQPDYGQMVENLAGMMLRYCLGRMMAGKPLDGDGFEPSDYETVKRSVAACGRQELEENLAKLLEILINQGYGGDRQLCQYLSDHIPDFASMLLHGAEHGCMDAMF